MRLQYTYIIEGEFQAMEYKNYIVHKVSLHNLERKLPTNPIITGSVSIKNDSKIVCIMEGEEQDLNSLRKEIERGPVIAHIFNIDFSKTQYSGRYQSFISKKHYH